MRRVDHLSPRYVKNKVLVLLDEKRHPLHPWITRQSVSLLDQLLRPTDTGVEFGSGRSTRWLAKRVHRLTSVESDRNWHAIVTKDCDDLISNATLDYRFAVEEAEYHDILDSIDDGSVDFCLVDGIHRDLCAVGIVPKMRAGGVLVVDNIDWFLPCDESICPGARRSSDGYESELWAEFARLVSEWRYVWTSNGVRDTGIWIKA